MILGAGALAGAVAAASSAAPAPADPVVHVAPLRTNLTASAEVGRRGQGWTCFPAGSVHWRDLSFDAREAAETVARSLIARGMVADVEPAAGAATGAASTTSATASRSYVLSGTIRAVAVKACSAWGVGKMLGGGAKMKGRVTVGIEWTLLGEPDTGVRKEFATESEAEIAAKKAGDEVFLATGLEQAGHDAATLLAPALAQIR